MNAGRRLICRITGYLSLIAWMLLSPCHASEQRIALVIGNGAYASAPLSNPVNDARLMTQTLKSLGFQVVTLENADQRGMKRAVRDFGDRLTAAGNDGLGLFYYSGHGAQAQDKTFLIPIGAQLAKQSDLDLEALDAQSILDQMQEAGTGVNVVILDACRDNPFASGSKSLSKGLSRLDAPVGSLIAYATAPGKTAQDGDGRNSPYTRALAQLLPTPGLSMTELFQKVRLQVLHDTGNHQVPWESSSLTRDVYLRVGGVPSSPPAQIASLDRPPQTVTQSAPTPESSAPLAASGSLLHPASLSALAPGTVFRDCPDCVEMVRVPTGSFQMGSPADEAGRYDDEGPVRNITIGYALAVGKFAVTRGQWRQFLNDAGKSYGDGCVVWDSAQSKWVVQLQSSWHDPGFAQDDSHPVVCVNWNQAQDYAQWLSSKTGKSYRLLSEAEYEFVNRAGASTAYPWGNGVDDACAHANVSDQSRIRSGEKLLDTPENIFQCNDGYPRTSPVGSFPANAFGLYDTSGNVWHWTQDCYHDSYAGAPTDASAWTAGDCARRVARGGSWGALPRYLRAALRAWSPASAASNFQGFRLARTD